MIYILLLTTLCGVLLFFVQSKGYRRGIAGIPTPRFSDAAGTFEETIDGTRFVMRSVSGYEIEGLVVHTRNYNDGSASNQLSPKDLGLAWGKIAEYNDRVDFHWSHGDRYLYFWQPQDNQIPNGDRWYDMQYQCSNNHVIPANDRVRKQIGLITTGDHVRLKGYLVYIKGYKDGKLVMTWDSSTTLYDSGNHSCEVFYVTDVEFIL